MESQELKFIGFNGKSYVFENNNGSKMVFGKCRNDLINDFNLHNDEFIKEWFKISYFQTNPLNKNYSENVIFIISNMEIKG
jgi:hypothetical protein